MMELHIEWGRPVRLRDGSKEGLIYAVDPLKLPQAPGVYIFARRWGSSFEALYVGKANNIQGRVMGQLNNLRLMQYLKKEQTGTRVVFAGRFKGRPGQRLEKSLHLVERALIHHFIIEGHDLWNVQGTVIRYHEVIPEGNQPRWFLPRLKYLERANFE